MTASAKRMTRTRGVGDKRRDACTYKIRDVSSQEARERVVITETYLRVIVAELRSCRSSGMIQNPLPAYLAAIYDARFAMTDVVTSFCIIDKQ